LRPITWITLVMVTIVALAGISQIPLVQDLVTASGYSNAEVFSGIGGILFFFYVVLAIFEVK
jgi:hypothetical protein